jgi:hypothetical protein
MVNLQIKEQKPEEQSLPGQKNLVFIKETYRDFHARVPVGHRGYLYVFLNLIEDESGVFDLVIGYEVITESKGLTDNPTETDLKRALINYSDDLGIAVVPFYKYPDVTPEKIRYEEFNAICKRTNRRINRFYIMSAAELNGVCYRGSLEKGVLSAFEPVGNMSLLQANLTSEDLKKIRLKKALLRRKKIKIEYLI